MKRIISMILFILVFYLLASCSTSINLGKEISEYEIGESNDAPQMEFIGYKADANILSTSSTVKIDTAGFVAKPVTVMSPFDQWKAIQSNSGLRTLGNKLENKNLATDQSYAYFGIYSLQELELYKGSKRYVTFVEVAQNKYDYNDKGIVGRAVLGGAGIGFLAGGIPLLVVGSLYKDNGYIGDLAKTYTGMGAAFTAIGGVSGLLALVIPVKCTTTFQGVYNVYIYDTQTKQVLRKDAVSVSSTDQWKGAYSKTDEAGKDLIHSYYSQIVANALLKKYDELNSWLKNR